MRIDVISSPTFISQYKFLYMEQIHRAGIFSSNVAAKSLQLCLTLCDPIDGSPPGSPVPGILQARTLEWVAISFSNAWKWRMKVKSLSNVWLLATPWTAAYQAPPPVGFSRQEYWSGVPLPSIAFYRDQVTRYRFWVVFYTTVICELLISWSITNQRGNQNFILILNWRQQKYLKREISW